MKKSVFYLNIAIVGILVPFVTVGICSIFDYDDSIVVALITAVSSIVVSIINAAIEKRKNQKESNMSINNNTNISINNNSGINISGKNKIKGSVYNKKTGNK